MEILEVPIPFVIRHYSQQRLREVFSPGARFRAEPLNLNIDRLAKIMPLTDELKSHRRVLDTSRAMDTNRFIVERASALRFNGGIEHQTLTVLPPSESLVVKRKFPPHPNNTLTFLILSTLHSTGRQNYGSLETIATLFEHIDNRIHRRPEDKIVVIGLVLKVRRNKEGITDIDRLIEESGESWARALRGALRHPLHAGLPESGKR